jgi:hypothetical protein
MQECLATLIWMKLHVHYFFITSVIIFFICICVDLRPFVQSEGSMMHQNTKWFTKVLCYILIHSCMFILMELLLNDLHQVILMTSKLCTYFMWLRIDLYLLTINYCMKYFQWVQKAGKINWIRSRDYLRYNSWLLALAST